jgi:hypothetical protein
MGRDTVAIWQVPFDELDKATMERLDENISTRNEGVPVAADTLSLFITAYTPHDTPICKETCLDYDGLVGNVEPIPDSHISDIWTSHREESDGFKWFSRLPGHLELRKEWLFVDFPEPCEDNLSDEEFATIRTQTGTTVLHGLHETDGNYTVVEGIEGFFDIGFRGLREEDFRYQEPESVQDAAERKRINDLIEAAIRNGLVTRRGDSPDTIRMRSLNRVQIGKRQLFIANYHQTWDKMDYEFTYIIENGNVTSLCPSRMLDSYVRFFTLHGDDCYLFHYESDMYYFSNSIQSLDPENASGDRTVYRHACYN